MKKYLKIVIGIFAIIILMGVLFFYVHDMYPEGVLEKEVNSLSSLDLKTDTIDMNIKTTGKYGIIEKAIKNYLNDYSTNLKIVISIMNDPRYVNVLSIQNYKEDGKEFVKTKDYLQKTKKTLNDSFTKLIDMNSKDVMMSYMDTSLGQKYVQLYQSYMYNDSIKKSLDESKKSLEESKISMDNTLDVYEQVIDFLVKNKNDWKIDGDNVIFNTQELLNQYNKLINNLK